MALAAGVSWLADVANFCRSARQRPCDRPARNSTEVAIARPCGADILVTRTALLPVANALCSAWSQSRARHRPGMTFGCRRFKVLLDDSGSRFDWRFVGALINSSPTIAGGRQDWSRISPRAANREYRALWN